jgi:hypothetical protein
MNRETVYRFEGGPLDGEERRKTRPARLPTFLTVSGDPLRVAVGDRIVSAAHGLTSARGGTVSCYTLKTDATAGARRVATYRFITAERAAS